MSASRFLVFDGILSWFAGPAWGDSARDAFESYQGTILDYAQSNAPWQDDTGAARAGLGVEVTESLGEITLTLFHTVDYGIWLETIQNGKFATIMPTLEAFAGQVFDEAGGVVIRSQTGEDYSL